MFTGPARLTAIGALGENFVSKIKNHFMEKSFSIFISLLYSNTMFACVFVCMLPISSGTAGPIWLNFFLLALSWSRDGFRPQKFRIRDPDYPENPDFWVFFDQFG